MYEPSEYYWIEEKKGQGTSIEISSDGKLEIDPLALGMMQNNHFAFLLPVTMECQDQRVSFHYCASSSTVEDWEKAWERKSFLTFLNGLIQLFKEMDSYFLDPHSLALERGLIFFDGEKIQGVALPYQFSADAPVDLGPFLKQIIISSRFDQQCDSFYLTNLLNQINGSQPFDQRELERYLQNEENAEAGKKEIRSKKEKNKKVNRSFTSQKNRSPLPGSSRLDKELLLEEFSDQVFQGNEDIKKELSPSLEVNKPVKELFLEPKKEKNPAPSPLPVEEPETISFFYLMKHFSQKNLARYQEQKAR